MKYRLVFGELLNLREDYPVISDLSKRFQHTYIIGMTGMGKSTLIERMAHYDLSQGYSVIYIDPKGTNVDRLYSLHQKNSKVKYVSFKKPITINPLNKSGYHIDTIITEFVQILDVLITLTSINPESSVRMKEIMFKSLKGFDLKDRNFEFLNKFLHFADVRKGYNFKDEGLKLWWNELENLSHSGFQKLNDYIRTMSSIESRLSMFLQNDEMKSFITGSNELDVEKLVENNESLLVNCQTSSNDNRIFLSNLIFYSIYSYIYQKKEKKPLLVYVDEFQLVASRLLSEMMQQARSFKIGFTFAHQNFESISPAILNSVISNAYTCVSFRVGNEESELLSKSFDTNSKTLMNLDDYRAFLKIGTNKTIIDTFKPIEIKETMPDNYNFLGDKWIKCYN